MSSPHTPSHAASDYSVLQGGGDSTLFCLYVYGKEGRTDGKNKGVKAGRKRKKQDMNVSFILLLLSLSHHTEPTMNGCVCLGVTK